MVVGVSVFDGVCVGVWLVGVCEGVWGGVESGVGVGVTPVQHSLILPITGITSA